MLDWKARYTTSEKKQTCADASRLKGAALCTRDRVTITLRLPENLVDAPNVKFSGWFLGNDTVIAR